MSRWQDLGYLMETAGGRTVPVEMGSHYLASGWGQQLMLLSDFILQHLSTPTAAFPRAENAGSLAQARESPAADLESRSSPFLRFFSSLGIPLQTCLNSGMCFVYAVFDEKWRRAVGEPATPGSGTQWLQAVHSRML